LAEGADRLEQAACRLGRLRTRIPSRVGALPDLFTQPGNAAGDAAHWAVEHLSERQAVFGHGGLLAATPGRNPGVVTAAAERAIAEATRRLVELRDRWLNLPERVVWVGEPVPGYPQHPVDCAEAAAKALKGRTPTKLCTARPPVARRRSFRP